jgi:hypothetical protein
MLTASLSPLFNGSIQSNRSFNEESFTYLEYFLSCITHTLCCDLTAHEVPGYFLPEVQSCWSTITAPTKSTVPFATYSCGQDDVKHINDLIQYLGFLMLSSGMDNELMTCLMMKLVGHPTRSLFGLLLTNDDSRWMLSPQTPLLSLPMLDVFVMVVSLSRFRYVVTAFEDDENDVVLSKLFPWLMLTRLVQIVWLDEDPVMNDNEEVSSEQHTQLVSDFPVMSRVLLRLIEMKSCHQRNSMAIERVPLRAKLFRYVMFLKAVSHILCRSCWLTFAEGLDNTWWFEHCSVQTLTEELLLKHIKSLRLTTFIDILTGNHDDTTEANFVISCINDWFAAEGTPCPPLFPDDEEDGMSIDNSVEEQRPPQRSTIVPVQIDNIQNAGSTNSLRPVYPLLPRYCHYPALTTPKLFALPTDYSKLHAAIYNICSYESPVLCLQCGAVLDGSGQGQCLAHSYDCSAGIGLFFTIQVISSCHILCRWYLTFTWFCGPSLND